jgi:hypothetical protein
MGTSSGQILSEPELAWRGQTPPFLSELDLGLEPKSAKFCPNRDLASKGITRGPIFLHHYGRSHGDDEVFRRQLLEFGLIFSADCVQIHSMWLCSDLGPTVVGVVFNSVSYTLLTRLT